MNSNDKISVIVPSYNVCEYLPRCLNSLLEQTYSNIEIIVVDDGSTDDTTNVLDAFVTQDSRVKAIYKKNGGVTSARICGIKEATGEWIGFVDGDDAIDSDMYERLLTNAKHYDAQISHCGHRVIHEDGAVRYFYNTGKLVEQDTATGLKDLLDGSFVEPGLCSKIFHKSVFDDLLTKEEMDWSVRYNEDLLMNVILFKKSKKSVYEDFCPYQYYARQGSATRQHLAEYTFWDPLRVRERIVDIVPAELKNIAKKTYLMTCINVLNNLLAQGKKAKEFQRAVREKLIEHYDYVTYLSLKYRAIAWCVRYLPWLYSGVYTVYTLTIRENIYE